MRWAWTVALAVIAPWISLSAQRIDYEGGVSLANGAYIFTERTTSWTVYSGLALRAGPLTVRTTVPAYRQSTTLLTGSSTGLVPTGGSASGIVGDSVVARRGSGRSSGTALAVSTTTADQMALGDPTVSANTALWRGSRTSVSLSATVKVPLTDTTGFGSGEWDFGGSVSLAQSLSLTTLVGIDVGYWHLGNMPDLELQDPVFATVSVSHLRPGGWGASASIFAARSAIEGFTNAYAVGVAITRLSGAGSLAVNASLGLTETTPDVTVGIGWRVGLLGR